MKKETFLERMSTSARSHNKAYNAALAKRLAWPAAHCGKKPPQRRVSKALYAIAPPLVLRKLIVKQLASMPVKNLTLENGSYPLFLTVK
jgi:hypothetical protein